MSLDHHRVELAPLLVAGLASWILLSVNLGRAEREAEDLALGRDTTAVYARKGDDLIHCRGVDDAEECLAGRRHRGAARTALWLGNSQVHSINQWREGQKGAPEILFEKLADHGIDLLTFSQPNANLSEHYVLFEYLSRRAKIDILILPVVFDDFRESGLRHSIVGALADRAVVASLNETAAGRMILAQHANDPVSSQDSDMAGIRQTVQEVVEKRINDWFAENWRLWAARPKARARCYLALYRLRNSVFNITATSKRRVIPGRYKSNYAALEALLRHAADVKTFVYVPPIRGDVEIPYDRWRYEAFKAQLEETAVTSGASFQNLEGLVPGKYWGNKESTNLGGTMEIDFMHFQAPGHELLAGALAETLLAAEAPR